MGARVIELREMTGDKVKGVVYKNVFLQEKYIGDLIGDGYSYTLVFNYEDPQGFTTSRFALVERIYGVAEKLSEMATAQSTHYEVSQVLTGHGMITGAVLKKED